MHFPRIQSSCIHKIKKKPGYYRIEHRMSGHPPIHHRIESRTNGRRKILNRIRLRWNESEVIVVPDTYATAPRICHLMEWLGRCGSLEVASVSGLLLHQLGHGQGRLLEGWLGGRPVLVLPGDSISVHLNLEWNETLFLSVFPSFRLSVFVFPVFLWFCLAVFLSLCLSVSLSICMSVSLSFSMCVCLSLSFFLIIHLNPNYLQSFRFPRCHARCRATTNFCSTSKIGFGSSTESRNVATTFATLVANRRNQKDDSDIID